MDKCKERGMSIQSVNGSDTEQEKTLQSQRPYERPGKYSRSCVGKMMVLGEDRVEAENHWVDQ